MSDKPADHYQDGCDMATLNQGRWYLWRDLSSTSEGESDWIPWFTSVPDTGQTGAEALAELLMLARVA